MKCSRCQGPLMSQYDRHYCMQCGNSIWKNFVMRKPMKVK